VITNCAECDDNDSTNIICLRCVSPYLLFGDHCELCGTQIPLCLECDQWN